MSIIVRGVDRENNAVVVVDVVVKNAASWTSEGTISRFSRVRPFQPSLRALYKAATKKEPGRHSPPHIFFCGPSPDKK